jgi:hypothetical protein
MANLPPLPDRGQPRPDLPPPLPAPINDSAQRAPSTADTNNRPVVGILIACALVLLVFLLLAFTLLQSVLSSSEQPLAANESVIQDAPTASSPEANRKDDPAASETTGGTEAKATSEVQRDSKNDSQPDAATGNEPSETELVDDSQTTKITETTSDSGLGAANDQKNPEMGSESEKTTDSVKKKTSTTQQPEAAQQPPLASSQPLRTLNTGSVKKTGTTEVPEETPMPENVASTPPVDQTEFTDRVKREGGKRGEFQITLIWNNHNDLDLHLYCPSREHIYFQHPNSRCGAALDIDMNAGFGRSNRPVENIVWTNRAPASGTYAIWVKHYATRGGRNPTAFQILVKQKGKTRTFMGRLQHNEKRLITYLHVP